MLERLQHAIERAVILCKGQVLESEDFFFNMHADRERENISFEDLNIEDMEKILVRKALKKHNGNITQAANELGLTRSSLYRRMEKYDL